MTHETDNSREFIERIPVSVTRQAWTQSTARELRRRATPSEAALWEYLRGRRLGGYRFRRQQPIGPYVVDFLCSAVGLVVEIDGEIHEHQVEYDIERQAELEGAGYRVLRVTVDRMLHELPGVLAQIQDTIRALLPLSRAQGEGAGG